MRIRLGALCTLAVIASVTATEGVRAQNPVLPPAAPVQAPPAPPEQAPPPPAPEPGRAQQPAFRAGVDIVSLNVTVMDADAATTSPTSTQQDFLGLRGRRQAGLYVLQPAPAADRAVAPARQQRQHGRQAADGAGRGHRLRPAAAAERPRAGDRLRQPRRDRAGRSRATCRSSRAAIRKTSAGGSTSLHNAIYIALKELKKVQARVDRGRAPAGDRRALGRRGHVEPGQLRRGARARQALRDRDLRDRASRGADTQTEGIQRGRLRAAPARAGDRRPGVLRGADRGAHRHLRADRRRARRASTRLATRRRTPSATAPGAASSSGSTGPTPPRARNRAITGRRRRASLRCA